MQWNEGTCCVVSFVAIMGLVRCGGETSGSTSQDAGGQDAPSDVQLPDVASDTVPADVASETEGATADANEENTSTCELGDQLACESASLTGCRESYRRCIYSTRSWSTCTCKGCTIPLDPGVCAWTLESSEGLLPASAAPDYVRARTVDAANGTAQLAYLGGEAECTNTGGYYLVDSGGDWPTLRTVTLCRASCDAHLQSPVPAYELNLVCPSD